MGKKIKLDDRVLKFADQENEDAKAAASTFYPDGIIANFTPSSTKYPLAALLTQAKQPSTPQSPTQEQLLDACLQIRENVRQGKPDNMEVQFKKGRQLSGKQAFLLGNTVVKILLMGFNQPIYLFIKGGDTLNASVFLGGDKAYGILVMKNESDKDYFLRLSEFHLLSLRQDPDPRKEIGLMTSYLWLTAKVYSSIIFAASLDPIKNLLLSDWLQAEWQRAKDATSKPANEATGGESNDERTWRET